MNLEVTKSFILTILVGISLLLTLGLWSYQPNYKSLNNQDYVDEADLDIGGAEVTKKNIIQPRSIIFHYYNDHYGFRSPSNQQRLYEDIQSWVLYEFDTKSANGAPNSDFQVEIEFPTALPMAMMDSIFTFNEDVFLPNWSTKRLFITFDRDRQVLNFRFLSVNESQQAMAVVNNAEKYDVLWTYVTTQERLREYLLVDDTQAPIYIPMEQVSMTRQFYYYDSINPNKLVNALFSNPLIVNSSLTSSGETYFTDTQSGMRVQYNGKMLEYFNPLNTNYERMNTTNLLDISIQNINNHKGWTTDFHLDDVNSITNFIQYRMYNHDYPIFNGSNLSIITQEWHNQELYQYQRPLFRLEDFAAGAEPVQLQSGNDVLYYIKTNDYYELKKINDIRLGYTLHFDGNLVTLEPKWYMNYNGAWQEIKFEDIDLIKGAS